MVVSLASDNGTYFLIKNTTFTAIDFESAGTASGKTDAPIQIGMATLSPDLEGYANWESYIHTDKPITWAAQKVHGITKEDLADAPKLMLLWPEIKQRLAGAAVVAHGHGTEKRFLRAFPGHGFGPWVDTLHLSRAVYPEMENHSLSHICETLDLKAEIDVLVPGKTWHDALYDAVASIVLLKQIIARYQLDNSPLATLLQPDTSAWRKVNAR